MAASHDVKNINIGSYRFNGYKLKRDENHNIIRNFQDVHHPEYWKTRALSAPDNIKQIPTTNG